ncbi:AEC family transporter [Fulvimarina sp. MAC8]|uniref:AEC family transporter n=1 Tax=Fulvimarina sp. MAC8 TaxID=3162874 RepID=UPI0032EDD1E1
MQTILDIIVPVFGLIAVGYLVARSKLLSDDVGQGLAKYVFVVAVPVLLFRSLSEASFGDANPGFLWLAYFGSVALAWTTGTLVIRWIAKADHRTGVIAGISASFANTVFVALPTLQRAYGDRGLEPLLLIIAIHLPVMMVASTLMVERAVQLDAKEADGGKKREGLGALLRRTGRNLATNSIIIGIACGLVWRATGLPLTGHFDEITQLIGSTAGPTALFALGMSLTRYGLKGDILSASMIAFISLIVQPGLVWVIGTELGLTDLWLKGAVLTAAAPAGVNAYLFAAYFGTGEKLAATTILLSTILAVFTLSGWLTVLSAT